MPTYGVTPEGFVRPSVQELLALIEADQRAGISATLDLSSDSVVGQLNGIFANQLGVAWEALEVAYNAFDPDRAEADALTSLLKLTGSERRGASKSELEGDSAVIVNLAPGTTLLAGVHFAHVDGKPDVRFTPQADFTASLLFTADYEVDFEAEVTGPVQAIANTLKVIATPVVGWNSVNNPFDAVLGRTVDSDADARLRREAALARTGSSTVDAIRADVLAVEDVTSVQVFENYTDATDTNGLPAKSFEVVLWDDAGADDDEIAQAIWGSKAGGIQPYGEESGTATDANGDPHTVAFSRANAVNIWIEYDLVEKDGYVGDADFELTVATALDAAFSTGQTVTFYELLVATEGLGALVRAVRFGTSASPTDDADVPITNRQIARFDTARISINP
jgi:uncharacterized phage protein gp47/JayE